MIMTLSLRNRIIKSVLLFSALLFVFYLISYFYLTGKSFFSFEEILSALKKSDNFSDWEAEKILYPSIINSAILFLFSMTTSILLFHYFKKKISPEIFFFTLFILSLSLQSVRFFQFHLLISGLSSFYGVILTRAFYFFHLFGIFCFFASSLFPIGIKFQKFGTILLIILLLSFTISALMPIDQTELNKDFLFSISDRVSLLLLVLSIRLLTVINFIRVTATTRSKNYLVVLIASVLIICGDMLITIPNLPYTGLILVLGGTVFYSRSIYKYYLWV